MGDVFITRRIFDETVDMLKDAGHNIEINNSSKILPKGKLIEKTQNKDGLICLLNDEIDAKLLKSCPDLKVVSNVAVGYDNINIEAATQNNVMVTNTPGVLTETVADLAFALILSSARRIPEADKYSRKGKYDGWELMQPHMGKDVYGKTLGILGMGRIGTAVAKRAAKGFNMNIIYHNKHSRRKDLEKEINAKHVNFQKLLKKSDFLTIHAPLTDKTKGTFGKKEFEKMKSNAILINTGRGPIVNENDLAEAIENNELRGAALDTFEDEPKINSKLANMEEFVVLTPHIGGASRETRLKMGRMAAENIITGLEEEKPPNVVNEKVLSD